MYMQCQKLLKDPIQKGKEVLEKIKQKETGSFCIYHYNSGLHGVIVVCNTNCNSNDYRILSNSNSNRLQYDVIELRPAL